MSLFIAACSADLVAAPAWNFLKGSWAAPAAVENIFPDGVAEAKFKPKLVKNPGNVPAPNGDCLGTAPCFL